MTLTRSGVWVTPSQYSNVSPIRAGQIRRGTPSCPLVTVPGARGPKRCDGRRRAPFGATVGEFQRPGPAGSFLPSRRPLMWMPNLRDGPLAVAVTVHATPRFGKRHGVCAPRSAIARRASAPRRLGHLPGMRPPETTGTNSMKVAPGGRVETPSRPPPRRRAWRRRFRAHAGSRAHPPPRGPRTIPMCALARSVVPAPTGRQDRHGTSVPSVTEPSRSSWWQSQFLPPTRLVPLCWLHDRNIDDPRTTLPARAIGVPNQYHLPTTPRYRQAPLPTVVVRMLPGETLSLRR